ncbi:single-stranded DNA-binding protein [Alteromonas sp. IB21]|uniref:single-stranded DNA-binding protein n=1 Tax=Alteromonas sp. IB21 TaxID=2779369 RepID=UPI0018E6F45C|nr:single-stranded DNA-binding protein [Alteromonas sp. IB21]MBJ2129111.1 single-stranded DNA-binding protein [Alteromonas sp. IB21]
MAINVFTASGNVGGEFDLRFTPNQKAIGTFSLPVKQGWGDNEKTSWVTCKMFGERAQKMAQYITKGIKLTVTGEFVLDEWEKDGVKHSRPVVIVNSLDFGTSPNNQNQQGNNSYQQGNNNYQHQANGQGQQPRNQAPQGQQQQPMGEPNFPLDDDFDIPY